jgi:hypothetical protein
MLKGRCHLRKLQFFLMVVCIFGLFIKLAYVFFSEYPDAMLDSLSNEELLSISPRLNSPHIHFSAAGADIMEQSSVTVIGVGKNVEHNLVSKLFKQFNELKKEFKEFRVILVLEDRPSFSADVHMIKEWEQALPAYRTLLFVNTSTMEDELAPVKGLKLPREGRIAVARNVALQRYRENVEEQTDYVMVVDLDIVGWSLTGVQDR